MLESLSSEKFEYKRLSLEEQKRRGILGRLVGVIADFKNPTRNGRLYSESLWDSVFENPIMKERIKNRVCFGELQHPADREEIDPEKVAVCLAEQPKKGKDGKLYGVFDIMSTPNGRILKSFCDYGCNVGISSRGTGDLYTDSNGNEAVDPDTYDCVGWDVVLIPGVESARLQYVTESLDTKKRNKTLRQKLTEEIEKASEDDRKVMEESLKNLDIVLNESTITEVKLDEASETRAWLLSQDGTEIPQVVHTKLLNRPLEDILSDKGTHKNLITYYKITKYDSIRELIKKLFCNINAVDPKLLEGEELPFDLGGECAGDDNDILYLYKLIFQSFNTEFLKVRVGGMYGENNESEIYFRISSKNVNWFNAIWSFLMKHKGIADYVTVVSDIEILHKEEYKKLNGEEIKHMPVEELLTAKGNPVVESKSKVSKFVYNLLNGQQVSESYGKSNYIGHIVEEYENMKDYTNMYNINEMFTPKEYWDTEEFLNEDLGDDVKDALEIVNDENLDAVKDDIVPENIDEHDEIEVISEKEADKIYDGEVNGKYPVMPGRYIIKHEPGEKVVAIDNSTEDAWTEEFETEEEAIRWLNGEFEVNEDINDEDNDEPEVYKYEALWYDNPDMTGDYDTMEFDTKDELMDFYNEHKDDEDKFNWWLTSRDEDWYVIDDIFGESLNSDKKKEIMNEQFYLRHQDIDKARDALLDRVDHEELLRALLAKNMKDQTIEDLCRQFGVEDKEFGVNIMTRDEMKDQFGVDDIKDLIKDEPVDEGCSDKEVVKEEAGNTGDDLVNQLQESLIKISGLEKDNLSLQEKLSVCNAKEVKLEEDVKRYKSSTISLSETAKKAKSLSNKVGQLEESLKAKDELLESNSLSLRKKDLRIKRLGLVKEDLNKKVENLTEELENKSSKLEESTLTIKKYQRALKESREAYVEAKAINNGLQKEEVLSKLNESYSLKDVDKLCESISEEKHNLGKLPFRINEGVKLNFKPSKEYIGGNTTKSKFDDDYVSDYLREMVKK